MIYNTSTRTNTTPFDGRMDVWMALDNLQYEYTSCTAATSRWLTDFARARAVQTSVVGIVGTEPSIDRSIEIHSVVRSSRVESGRSRDDRRHVEEGERGG
jgi:hypothetical protein